MAQADIRKGMPSVELSREEFEKRYRSRFADPAFKPLEREISAHRRRGVGRLQQLAQGADNAQGRAGFCRSGL